jgi:nucleoid DNA-binding protein
MKKNALVENIARSAAIDETAAERAINVILSGIVESLRQKNQVSLGDFGAFKLFLSNNSNSNDDQTNLQKNSKNTLRFIPSTKLRTAINEPE